MPSKLVLAMLIIITCLFTLADFFPEGIRSTKQPSRSKSKGQKKVILYLKSRLKA
jgi:hypothetical protein